MNPMVTAFRSRPPFATEADGDLTALPCLEHVTPSSQ